MPDGYAVVTAVAIGYFGDVDDLDEDLRVRERAPRVRRAVGESVWRLWLPVLSVNRRWR